LISQTAPIFRIMRYSTYPRSEWRLLLESIPEQGAWNLAVDETLLREVAIGESFPTLRLYCWKAPALIIGRGQCISDVNQYAVHQDGIELLRRMTGGTAVLNTNVISYSVAVPGGEKRLSGSIAESYRGISIALAAGLALIGLKNVEAKSMDQMLAKYNRTQRSPVCFEIPSYYELTVNGRKLLGSSQKRIRGGILQHGAFYLDGDISDICRYLTSKISPDRIRSKTITLREALGRPVDYYDVAQAFVQGFKQTLSLNFDIGKLLPHEDDMIRFLIQEKYGHSTWTERM
jgi:lipoate-protein ligase A